LGCELLSQTVAKAFATIDVSDDNTKNNTSNGARGAKMIFSSGWGAGFKMN